MPRGGKRKGAGRKFKYKGSKTANLTVSWPILAVWDIQLEAKQKGLSVSEILLTKAYGTKYHKSSE